MFGLPGKCKFWKHCNCYDPRGDICNLYHGDAYGNGRGGGCFRSLSEEGKESRYWR